MLAIPVAPTSWKWLNNINFKTVLEDKVDKEQNKACWAVGVSKEVCLEGSGILDTLQNLLEFSVQSTIKNNVHLVIKQDMNHPKLSDIFSSPNLLLLLFLHNSHNSQELFVL